MKTRNTKPNNPFVVQGYMGKEYFCNRESETELMLQSINNGLNTTLISGRRKGKSNLIHHVFAQLKTPSIYVDIFHIQSFEQFSQLLTEEVIRQYGSPKQDFLKRAGKFLTSFKPTLSYDAVSGEPQLGVQKIEGKNTTQLNQPLNELFKFLENEKQVITIAIDEFQEICSWNNSTSEASLRTLIQQHPKIRFIFSGSDRQLMNEMFTKRSRPFYRSAELLYLNKIDPTTYERFIQKKFKQHGKAIETDVVKYALDWCRGETYYIQRIFNRIFAHSVELTLQTLPSFLNGYLKEKESEFQVQLNLISKNQQDLLFALARENGTKKPNSTEFIKKHNLSSSSTVNQNLVSLTSKDLIEEHNKTYFVSDVFFARWMEGI